MNLRLTSFTARPYCIEAGPEDGTLTEVFGESAILGEWFDGYKAEHPILDCGTDPRLEDD